MFAKINREQLLGATGWSGPDLNNRNHNNQISLSLGLMLPAETGVYIGFDCFALRLFDTLVQGGLTLSEAGQLVRDDYKKVMRGLERIEWPKLFPPPEPTKWAPTPQGLAAGIPEYLDTEIYFAIAKIPNGDFRTACGTMVEIVHELMFPLATEQPARGPPLVTQVHLRGVYEQTLAAAKQAGVDLGAPFTRPEGHPEHREWFEAVANHRALSLARQKLRKPPGPKARAKGKAKGQRPGAHPQARDSRNLIRHI